MRLFGKTRIDEEDFLPIDPIPSLVEVARREGLNPEKVTLGIELDDQDRCLVRERSRIVISEGDKIAYWQVTTLENLFRGEALPPDVETLQRTYCACFFSLEKPLLTLGDENGDPTDQEMESVYCQLRRRPDGKSQGLAHDVLWQAAAVMLGKFALSRAQYEAVIGRLEQSARTFSIRPVSRNYLTSLRNVFG